MAGKLETDIHRVFEASILAKGAFAMFEIVSGLALAFVGTGTIYHFAALVTQHELIRHPADPIARHILHAAESFSVDTKTFASIYLLIHGVIKLGLVVELLRGKLWAYPASIVAFGAFIAYQLYRWTYTHSVALLLLTVFDLIVLWLVWHEWRVTRRAREDDIATNRLTGET